MHPLPYQGDFTSLHCLKELVIAPAIAAPIGHAFLAWMLLGEDRSVSRLRCLKYIEVTHLVENVTYLSQTTKESGNGLYGFVLLLGSMSQIKMENNDRFLDAFTVVIFSIVTSDLHAVWCTCTKSQP
jgi:hypothetical protein